MIARPIRFLLLKESLKRFRREFLVGPWDIDKRKGVVFKFVVVNSRAKGRAGSGKILSVWAKASNPQCPRQVLTHLRPSNSITIDLNIPQPC